MDVKKHIVSMHSGKPRRKHCEEACCAMLTELHVPFQREVIVKFPSDAPRKFARLDVFWRTRFGAVMLEVDEYAHRGSCYSIDYECQRMALIFEALSKTFGGRLHILRYNPHPIRGERQPTEAERKEAIARALAFEPQAPLTITYLFYHLNNEGFPKIALSPHYTLRNHIRLQSSTEPYGATSM